MTDRDAYFAADAGDRRAALADATQHLAGAQWSYGHGIEEHFDVWLRSADRAYWWLRQRESLIPVRIVAGRPVITEQAGGPVLTMKAGQGMPTVITDTQIATYPAAEEVDSKGFALSGAVTLTDDDSAGAIVARTDNADGSSSFSAVAPGTVNLTWSDGTLSLADTLEVDPGAAASIQVGAPVITDQVAETEPPVAPIS